MFWTDRPDLAYEDGHSIPRRTYKCKGSTLLTKKNNPNAVKQGVTHSCKLVTDHPKSCICVCGHEFNRKEEQGA